MIFFLELGSCDILRQCANTYLEVLRTQGRGLRTSYYGLLASSNVEEMLTRVRKLVSLSYCLILFWPLEFEARAWKVASNCRGNK